MGRPPNILSYTSPVSGKVLKNWIRYNIANETNYTKIANKMVRFLNCKDNHYYIVRRNNNDRFYNRNGVPRFIVVRAIYYSNVFKKYGDYSGE